VAVLPFLSSIYATNIYLAGTTKFDAVPTDYVEPTKQSAAAKYTNDQIKRALDLAYITQEQHDETIAYKAEV
jgi:hypothetical protein